MLVEADGKRSKDSVPVLESYSWFWSRLETSRVGLNIEDLRNNTID